MRVWSKGILSGRCGPRAHGNQRIGETNFADLFCFRSERGAVWASEFDGGMKAFDRIAHELVLQHFNFMIERLVQP